MPTMVDTLEKLMEMAGPIVQDMVRAIEKPLTQLGNLREALYLRGTRPSTEELIR